jgi:hypothetical protein
MRINARGIMAAFSVAQRTLLRITVIALATTCVVHAQWSILAPGKREPPAGQHRYAMLVLANPVPGLEQEFNDWYTNTHMGDLVQLPGWMGAQRFRIVSSLNRRPTREGYRHGYLIVWDQEGADYANPQRLMTEAIAGGKSRRGAGFDYIGGMGGGGTFQVIGPRISRADGKPPFMPDVSDNKTTRPDKYLVMDFANPSGGRDAEFDAAMDQRIKDVLTLPGWMAAQRYALAPPPVGGSGSRPNKPRFLTMWETEGRDVNVLQASLDEAVKAGKVKTLPVDEATWEFTYWKPITPYITKEDFER